MPAGPVPHPKLGVCADCGHSVRRGTSACPRCGGSDFVPMLMNPPFTSFTLREKCWRVLVGLCALAMGIAAVACFVWVIVRFTAKAYRWLASP